MIIVRLYIRRFVLRVFSFNQPRTRNSTDYCLLHVPLFIWIDTWNDFNKLLKAEIRVQKHLTRIVQNMHPMTVKHAIPFSAKGRNTRNSTEGLNRSRLVRDGSEHNGFQSNTTVARWNVISVITSVRCGEYQSINNNKRQRTIRTMSLKDVHKSMNLAFYGLGRTKCWEVSLVRRCPTLASKAKPSIPTSGD